jgi:hypothetical protein
MAETRARISQEEANEKHLFEVHPFDPLMAVLAKFKSSSDLLQSIHLIFSRLDESGDGEIDVDEMIEGLPRIVPGVEITKEDWFHLTNLDSDDQPWYKLASKGVSKEVSVGQVTGNENDDPEPAGISVLTEADFRKLCLRELKAYLLRESNKSVSGGEDPILAIVMAVKWLLISADTTVRPEEADSLSTPSKTSPRAQPPQLDCPSLPSTMATPYTNGTRGTHMAPAQQPAQAQSPHMAAMEASCATCCDTLVTDVKVTTAGFRARADSPGSVMSIESVSQSEACAGGGKAEENGDGEGREGGREGEWVHHCAGEGGGRGGGGGGGGGAVGDAGHQVDRTGFPVVQGRNFGCPFVTPFPADVTCSSEGRGEQGLGGERAAGGELGEGLGRRADGQELERAREKSDSGQVLAQRVATGAGRGPTTYPVSTSDQVAKDVGVLHCSVQRLEAGLRRVSADVSADIRRLESLVELQHGE